MKLVKVSKFLYYHQKKDDVPTNFLSFYSTFIPVTSANTQESEQHDLVNQEIETEIKLYLAEENSSAQKVEALSLRNFKKYILIWPGLQEGIFRHHVAIAMLIAVKLPLFERREYFFRT